MIECLKKTMDHVIMHLLINSGGNDDDDYDYDEIAIVIGYATGVCMFYLAMFIEL